jgi:hypothetical protein
MKYIKLRVIIIFAIVILLSFIPETFPDFFGDWECQGSKIIGVNEGFYQTQGCSYGGDLEHSPTTHWGFRHWMWTLCGVTLFIWNVVELINKKYLP